MTEEVTLKMLPHGGKNCLAMWFFCIVEGGDKEEIKVMEGFTRKRRNSKQNKNKIDIEIVIRTNCQQSLMVKGGQCKREKIERK